MREMRRQDRLLKDEETAEILKKGEYGVLATVGADGQPYCVPMTYAYDPEKQAIWMHCSNAGGQKLDNITFNDRVCFTVVGGTELLPDKFATKYWSAIVIGRVRIAEDPADKQKGLEAIVAKYSPEFMEKGLKYISGAIARAHVLCLEVQQMTGKARKN